MVDFIVIGAMKAATSTVCAYLEDHPDVFMLPRAEPNYFSHDENFARGPEWYESLFAARGDEAICGEGSNAYSARDLYPLAAERMAKYNPKMKVIYILRHPVERLVSAWIQNRSDARDRIPATLEEAVRALPDHLIGQSRYWHNLEPYRTAFGDRQIFIGFMEDLQSDPDRFFEGLCAFLGVPTVPAVRPHQNKSAGKRVPTKLSTLLSKLPLSATLKSLLPGAIKRTLRDRLLSKTMDERPSIPSALKDQLRRSLEADSHQMLQHCGKPEDFWRFD